MIWIVEMQNGGTFEAATKRKAVDQMIQHYAENNRDAEQIKAIFCIFKDDRTNELCGDAISRIQSIVDAGVSEWRKISEQNDREKKMLISDYREAIF